jgi:hypothetical protein
MKGIQSFQLNNFFTLENVEQYISNEPWKAIFDHYCDQKKRFDNQVDLLLYFDIIKSIFDFLLSQGRLVKLNAIELYEQFCEKYDEFSSLKLRVSSRFFCVFSFSIYNPSSVNSQKELHLLK